MKCPVCNIEYNSHIAYEECYNSHFNEKDQYTTYHQWEIEKIRKKEYFEGYKQALYDFAIHKDGKLFVGCGFYTYKQAVNMKYKEIYGVDYNEIPSDI